jgi:hypothetical protein
MAAPQRGQCQRDAVSEEAWPVTIGTGVGELREQFAEYFGRSREQLGAVGVKRQLILASHNANLVVELVALLWILGPSQHYRTMVRSIHFRTGTP